MLHYHVMAGLRGCYMPDSNERFDTLQEATDYAATEAAEWSEAHEKPVTKHSDLFYSIGDAHCVYVDGCDQEDCEGGY